MSGVAWRQDRAVPPELSTTNEEPKAQSAVTPVIC